MARQPIDWVLMEGYTKREIATFVGGFLIATLLVGGLAWYLLGIFMSSDPNDPLTKAGGLKPSHTMQVK
jgi:hypothetical protein